MKKILVLAALVVTPLLITGCCKKYDAYDNCATTIAYDPNPVCPPAQPAVPCPPVVNCTPAVSPAPVIIPAPRPIPAPAPLACPTNTCAPVAPYAPFPVAQAAPIVSTALPAGGISYMEPVQVSGANTVQFYNPYVVGGGIIR